MQRIGQQLSRLREYQVQRPRDRTAIGWSQEQKEVTECVGHIKGHGGPEWAAAVAGPYHTGSCGRW